MRRIMWKRETNLSQIYFWPDEYIRFYPFEIDTRHSIVRAVHSRAEGFVDGSKQFSAGVK